MQYAILASQTVVIREDSDGLDVFALQGSPDFDHLAFIENSSPDKRDDETWAEWDRRWSRWSKEFAEAHSETWHKAVVVASWYMYGVTAEEFLDQMRLARLSDKPLVVERTPKYQSYLYGNFTTYMRYGHFEKDGSAVCCVNGTHRVRFAVSDTARFVVEWNR